MTPLHAIAVLAALLPLHAEEPDLLRFTNGDQLQGQFEGLDGGGRVTWTRPDVSQPMEFQRDKVRQVVLKGGHPLPPGLDSSHVSLVNGDRIPGRITGADAAVITLETSIAGTIELPRDTVASFSPNPFGGRLLYAGPFDDRRWNIVRTSVPGQDDTPAEDADAEKAKPVWAHSGAAWYYRQGNDALVLDANMPDRALVRFKMAWRSTPNLAFAFHADLAKEEPKDKDAGDRDAARRQFFGGPQAFARYFGNSYVATFQPGYNNLYRCSFDDDGQPRSERIRSGNTPLRINTTGEAVFEVRCDRKTGLVALYIDGELAVQWNTLEEGADGVPYTAPGSAIGFQVMGSSTPIRISDIVVAEWNGMTDSARSMDSEDLDIVLLGNGTDRFSGRVTAIQDDHLELDGKYAGLKIPLAEVAEVHFARAARRKPEEPPASEITVHFQPVGRISGIPGSATGDRLKLDSPLAGSLDLDLSPAVLIEFQSAGGFLDAWDDDF